MARIRIPTEEAGQAVFWTKKGLGQHLLRDVTVVQDICKALAPAPGEAILEIGPGLGALTEPLIKLGGTVLAVEVDPRACLVLKQRFAGHANFILEQADVLESDLTALCASTFKQGPFHIAANLPYYITTPILAQVLESGLPFTRMVALVQREVGLRLAAGPGGKEYGALTVMAQFRSQVTFLRRVLPGAFTPVPRVESALILFERRLKPAVEVKNQALFFKIVRSAFGKRRKTLSNALKMAEKLGWSAPQLAIAFKESGIDPGRRAETLDMKEFGVLADVLAGIPPEFPTS